MIQLACPVCKESSFHEVTDCEFCEILRVELTNDIPDLIPRWALLNPVYSSEIKRYGAIAITDPKAYSGYSRSMPEKRATWINGLLRKNNVTELVNIGPGFGALEEVSQVEDHWALDHCYSFLNRIQRIAPDVECVRGIAEALPFATDTVPCLVADCVFQSVVDREAFLYEVARALTDDGYFIFSVATCWNYPRRPQDGFNVTRPDEFNMLIRYLEGLNFEVRPKWMDLVENRGFNEYLLVEARKHV